MLTVYVSVFIMIVYIMRSTKLSKCDMYVLL